MRLARTTLQITIWDTHTEEYLWISSWKKFLGCTNWKSFTRVHHHLNLLLVPYTTVSWSIAIHIIFHFARVSFKGSPSLNPLADPIFVINLEFAGEPASCSCRLQVDHGAFLCKSLWGNLLRRTIWRAQLIQASFFRGSWTCIRTHDSVSVNLVWV